MVRSKNKTSDGATLLDVAKAAGVCKATVSYIINDKPGASPELREKVRAIMRKMNYSPRPAARQLTTKRSDTLGVVIEDLTPGFLLSVFHGLLIQATMQDYHAITAVSSRAGDESELPVRMVTRASVDGLLWLDPRATPEMMRLFKKRNIPFVVIQNDPQDPDINTISTENAQGAKDAVRHLLDLGYKRLTLITGPKDNITSIEKLEGARQALRDKRVKLPAGHILIGDYNGDVAVKAFENFLAKGNKLPDAIFAFNDDMALALLHNLRDKGIRVPKDVAIVGFDGTDDARRAELTTIEIPTREMGAMAARLLVDIIRDTSANRRPQHILLKGNLVIRKSCGAQM